MGSVREDVGYREAPHLKIVYLLRHHVNIIGSDGGRQGGRMHRSCHPLERLVEPKKLQKVNDLQSLPSYLLSLCDMPSVEFPRLSNLHIGRLIDIRDFFFSRNA